MRTGRPRKLTDEQVTECARLHFEERLNCHEIALRFGVTNSTVSDNISMRLGLKPRKHISAPVDGPTARSFDADEWTPEHSYWLGLLHADGHVSERAVSLGLKGTDEYLVRAFAEFCSFSGKINFRPARRVKHLNGKFYNHSDFYTCRIGSKLLAASLIEKGIKANDKTIWAVPCGEADYVRGMFDGNGSISAKDSKQWRMAYYGRYGSCKYIQDFLFRHGVKISDPVPDRNIFRLYVRTKADIKAACDLLYRRDGIRMHRKDVFAPKPQELPTEPSSAMKRTPAAASMQKPTRARYYKIFGT